MTAVPPTIPETMLGDACGVKAVARTFSPLHVLVVDEELPYPLNSGKRIRTFQLLKRLASRHRITYLAHRNADAAEAAVAADALRGVGMAPVVVDRVVPPKSGLAFAARLIANLASPLPYSVASHSSGAMRQAIRRHLHDQRCDLVHCEWTPYAENLRRLGDVPCLTISAHNVESQIWRRYYENERRPLHRGYIHHQWRKFARFERWAFQRGDQTIFVSEQDAQLARSEFEAPCAAVVENGVDTTEFQPVFSGRDPFKLLLMGSLDWRPNLDGIERFVRVVVPQVRAMDPRVSVTVIGRHPHPSFTQWIRSQPAVSLHANVPDVQEYTRRAGALVVPLRIGGGSRLKILEAAAAGLPILSTRIGAEGLRFRPDEHYSEVDTIDQLAVAIRDHMRQPERSYARAVAARQVVEEHYDWSKLAQRLEGCWLERCRV